MFELVVIVAIIVGVTEAIKRTGFLSPNYSAIVSIVLGVIAMYFTGEGDVVTNIFSGIVAGLTASGLYSGTRATLR